MSDVKSLGAGIFRIPITTINDEINIIKKLVSKINKKLLFSNPIIINCDEDIDWESDFGRRIYFNGNKFIRTGNISVIGKNIVFEVTIFEE